MARQKANAVNRNKSDSRLKSKFPTAANGSVKYWNVMAVQQDDRRYIPFEGAISTACRFSRGMSFDAIMAHMTDTCYSASVSRSSTASPRLLFLKNLRGEQLRWEGIELQPVNFPSGFDDFVEYLKQKKNPMFGIHLPRAQVNIY